MMKRLICYILAAMMASVCMLAACESGSGEQSSTESSIAYESGADSKVQSEEESIESVGESSIEEESEAESEAVSEEESNTESKEESDEESGEESENEIEYEGEVEPVNLLFARYTQSPHFVVIGTCTMGAKITAEYRGQKVTVDSYMGWFELTLKNTANDTFLDIVFTQKIDGKAISKPKTLKAKPSVPEYKGTRAIGSNGAFQFFLEQMVADYEGGNLFSDSAISTMTNRVAGRIEQLHGYNRDAEIIYMIVPSPMTTYPELVPDYYTKGGGKTRYEQVKEGLENAGATVIDLRETFNKHKHDEMPLYYHLDSHWADYGAYLAYVELFEHISKRYPDAKPRGIDEFTWTADFYTSADACLYLDIPQIKVKEYGYYREFDFKDPSNITSVPRYRGMQLIYNDLTTEEKYFNNNNPKLPSCMVFRDSYSAGIYDILAERMNKTHYIGMWNYAWQNWLIDSEKPDYVIYIIAEWNMPQVVYN
ncbi:MAG: hypothetical protein IJY88_02250 [Clostridia bacterium]|nr:hypothetical protein [Clostridia bacterium]